MIAPAEIRRWPLPEKLAVMEALWTELSSDPDQLVVPDWHRDILSARHKALQAGSNKVLDWEEAKEQIRKARP